MTNINQDFLTAIGNRLRKLRKSKKAHPSSVVRYTFRPL